MLQIMINEMNLINNMQSSSWQEINCSICTGEKEKNLFKIETQVSSPSNYLKLQFVQMPTGSLNWTTSLKLSQIIP